jgi:hypothetical protein
MKLQRFLLPLFLAISGAANADLYKCVDANNKPSYQERPCAGTSKTVSVEKRAGPVREYSASMVDVKSGRVRQKFAVTPDKFYAETFDAFGQREKFSIIRLDQRKMYVFSETNKTYIELPFNDDRFTIENLSFGMIQVKEEKKVGEETVNGYKTSKFHIKVTAMGLKSPVTVYSWVAPEFGPSFPVRLDVNGVVDEMRNINTNRPDAALFEIRKGYQRDQRRGRQIIRDLSQKK